MVLQLRASERLVIAGAYVRVCEGMVQILTSVAAFSQGLNESISQARLYPLADTLQYDG